MQDILVHVPHSSLKIPKSFWKYCLIEKKDLYKENYFLCDNYVNKFIPKKCKKIVFKYSRMFCDVERFIDDNKEIMFKKGMGVIYTKTSTGKLFLNYNEEYKELVIKKYYDKHHNKLNKITNRIINKHNKCIIVDLHSFSDKLVYNIKKLKNNPDICIGFDKEYCDEYIIKYTMDYFKSYGYSVKYNYPYKGSIVPDIKNKHIKSIMIEINKRIYMNENRINKIKYKKLKKILNNYFKQLSKITK